MEIVTVLLSTLNKWTENSWSFIETYLLLRSEQAEWIMYGIIILMLIFIIDIWVRSRQSIGTHTIVLASLLTPIGLLLLTLVPSGFVGTHDDNCHKYEHGGLVFTLVDYTITPVDFQKPYGSEYLILIVMAEPRWGNNTHTCRLTLNDPKAQSMIDQLPKRKLQGKNLYIGGKGAVTFSFGGKAEKPNVILMPNIPPGKDGPPEKAPDEI